VRTGLVIAAAFAWTALANAQQQQQPPSKQIAVTDARLHIYDDGPAVRETDTLGPGDGLWVSARFSGYSVKVDEDKDKRFIHLTYRFEAVDPDGISLVESKTQKIETDLAREDKTWMPKVRFNFLLPPLPDSGVYKVILTVTDEFNKSTTRRELPFRVKSFEVEKSDKLVARNFRFQRREEDSAALNPPVYRAGETVWARFDMTGYKIGELNAFDVAYGLEVLRGTDQKSMYTEPNAAREKDAMFYRKRYLQGALSLNLNKDLAKGDYVLILKIRDEAGGQAYESRHTFSVE
jgi:hypothetical protein